MTLFQKILILEESWIQKSQKKSKEDESQLRFHGHEGEFTAQDFLKLNDGRMSRASAHSKINQAVDFGKVNLIRKENPAIGRPINIYRVNTKIHLGMHYLSICACVNFDREWSLLQWYKYHLATGVEHFYLIDDSSPVDIRACSSTLSTLRLPLGSYFPDGREVSGQETEDWQDIKIRDYIPLIRGENKWIFTLTLMSIFLRRRKLS